MNKRSLHTTFSVVKRIRTWQLVVILLIGLVLAASFLRLNNLEMDKRRTAVMQADKLADKEATKQALVDLQRYVSAHMNTSLGKGFYLEHQYNRDKETALKAATSTTNPNSAIYQQASIECRNRFQGGVASFRNDYVACVAERVRALSPSTDPTVGLNLPKAESYYYNFTSPLWSPDLAGIMVLFCFIVTSVIVLRAIAAVVLRLVLKHRFKTI
jgi:hypothetical protein